MRYSLEKVDAVVLAGGINRIPLFQGNTPGYKGLLRIAGIPLIRYTLECLSSVPFIHRICIVGPRDLISDALTNPEMYEYEPAGETLFESLSSGLDHFKQSGIVLFTTADLPLLTAGAVTDFLEACRGIDTTYRASIFWSVVPEQSFTGAFQRVKKSFNRFRDTAVCHGNLLLVTPEVVKKKRLVNSIERIYEKRKSSVLSALALDPVVGATYLFGVRVIRILTLHQMAVFLSKYFNMSFIPVIHEHPESAVDIDEPQDYEFVCEQLAGRAEC